MADLDWDFAVAALKQGHFVEAAKTWHKAEKHESKQAARKCSGNFSVINCATCLEVHLWSSSLTYNDSESAELALDLKNWITAISKEMQQDHLFD